MAHLIFSFLFSLFNMGINKCAILSRLYERKFWLSSRTDENFFDTLSDLGLYIEVYDLYKIRLIERQNKQVWLTNLQAKN